MKTVVTLVLRRCGDFQLEFLHLRKGFPNAEPVEQNARFFRCKLADG